jgi:hypothetical protein
VWNGAGRTIALIVTRHGGRLVVPQASARADDWGRVNGLKRQRRALDDLVFERTQAKEAPHASQDPWQYSHAQLQSLACRLIMAQEAECSRIELQGTLWLGAG